MTLIMTLHKGTMSDGWPAWRQLRAAGCLSTQQLLLRIKRDPVVVPERRSENGTAASDSDQRSAQRSAEHCAATSELEPMFSLSGAPLLQRAPVRHRIQCLDGCGSGHERRHLGITDILSVALNALLRLSRPLTTVSKGTHARPFPLDLSADLRSLSVGVAFPATPIRLFVCNGLLPCCARGLGQRVLRERGLDKSL